MSISQAYRDSVELVIQLDSNKSKHSYFR